MAYQLKKMSWVLFQMKTSGNEIFSKHKVYYCRTCLNSTREGLAAREMKQAMVKKKAIEEHVKMVNRARKDAEYVIARPFRG